MTADNRAAATVSRLLAVDWSGDAGYDHPRARAKLFREYLRRAALWAKAFAVTDEWPFFDVAALLAPDIAVPAEPAAELAALIDAKIGWPSVAAACRASLRWAAVLDAGVRVPDTLSDPYEPLLLLFELGGGFTTEHGFVDLGGASVPLKSLRDHASTQPVVALDPATLGALD